MKNKLQLKWAVIVACVCAALHRLTTPDALALGNDAAEEATEEVAELKPKEAAKELKQRDADEKAIREMVAGGLDRPQAEAALKHKKDFTERFAEAQKAAKK
ncbi:MAG TPA: hypothetical protein VHY30_01525 [Verrucomicrobiae bacterium]|jgi:hypothetical protein|nr:hypothetical protein [Verrucomicrobiae bacterium]